MSWGVDELPSLISPTRPFAHSPIRPFAHSPIRQRPTPNAQRPLPHSPTPPLFHSSTPCDVHHGIPGRYPVRWPNSSAISAEQPPHEKNQCNC
jgi:hypothetical protein